MTGAPFPLEPEPGTTDRHVIRSVPWDYRHLVIQPDDRVLDLGANIGAFSWWAFQQGASLVTAVEPHLRNIRRLLELEPHCPRTFRIYPAAIGAPGPCGLTLPSPGNYASTLVTPRGFDSYAVPIGAVYPERYNVVKVDIEGGERFFPPGWTDGPDGSRVREVIWELHGDDQSFWGTHANAMRDHRFILNWSEQRAKTRLEHWKRRIP